MVCSEGQHEIRELDEHGNPKEEPAEDRIRRLSREVESRRRAASSSSSASSSSDSTGSSGGSEGSEGSDGSDQEDSGQRTFVEFGHDERYLLWAPDLHVVNSNGKPQVHSELMRMYVAELFQTLALALT